MAVTRIDGSWPAGAAPFGPDERLNLEAALRAQCVAPARTAAEEGDRGRLVPGQRADLMIVDAAAVTNPIEPGGALANARPRLVMIDGDVAFER
jgi:predicted amidohydrolase YtcJ